MAHSPMEVWHGWAAAKAAVYFNGTLSSSSPHHVMTGIPVADFEPAAEFYARLLGRKPDVVASEGREVLWQVRDLAWIYVVVDPERAGSALMAWLVGNLDATIAELAAQGIEAGEPVSGGGTRKATVTDPDGNSIAFVEAP
jgi:catechol 2,3-dioxygenase-like lactoylglutathione lyase family enzyme